MRLPRPSSAYAEPASHGIQVLARGRMPVSAALLIQRQAYVTATGYVVGSAILSIVALFCGLWIVRSIYA